MKSSRSFRTTYYANLFNKTEPYPGITELLDSLAAASVPMAIVSNKPHVAVEPIVERLLDRWEWVFVTGEREGVPRKPDPTMASHALAAMGVRADGSVFVGDTSTDIATAKAAGMRSVGCSWGFRDRKSLTEAGADHIVDRPEELLALPWDQKQRGIGCGATLCEAMPL